MTNNTDKVIPKRLEDELLNLNTYGLNNLWTEYHNNRIQNQIYDYQMEVIFTDSCGNSQSVTSGVVSVT